MGSSSESSLLPRLRQLLSGDGGVRWQSEPLPIKTFIDGVINSPLETLTLALSEFEWKYGKGNFDHWRRLFIFFHTYFKGSICTRNELILSDCMVDDGKFPKQEALQILRVMKIILENCHNKSSFSGMEHFKLLLASTDHEILIATLETLCALVKINPSKKHEDGKLVGCGSVNSHLLSLVLGWGSKEEGLGLYSRVTENEKSQGNDAGIAQYSTLNYNWYGSGSQSTEGSLAPNVIHETDFHKKEDDDVSLMRQFIEKYQVPSEHRFSLLTRIRYAHACRSPTIWQSYIRISLLSFIVLIQSSDSLDELVLLFANEPEYTNELVRIVRSDESICGAIRTLSMNAVTAQFVASGSSHERARILRASGFKSGDGNQKIFATMLEKSLKTLNNSNVDFGEALVQHFLFFVISCSNSGSAYHCFWLLSIILPLLKDPDQTHLHLVCLAAETVQKLLYSSSEAVTLFKEFGGEDLLTARLKTEIKDNGGSEQSNRLIRVLLKVFKLLGTYDDSPSLCQIFSEVDKFGLGVYHTAATVMTDMIDEVDEDDALGDLVSTFVSSVVLAGGISPSKALWCVPNVLCAICHNAKGLEAVKKSSVLGFLVDVFTEEKYLVSNIEDIRSFARGVGDLLCCDSSLRVLVVHCIIHKMSMLVDSDTSEGVTNDQFIQLSIVRVLILVQETMENSDTCRLFVENSGIESLFKLLLMRSILQASEGMSILLQGSMVFKCLTRHHSAQLAKTFCSSLKTVLATVWQDLRVIADSRICSSLFRIEFLLFLAALNDDGWKTALLKEFGTESNSVLDDIGRVHREVLWQVALLEDNNVEEVYAKDESQLIMVDSEKQRSNSFRQLFKSKLPEWSTECKLLYVFTLNLAREVTSSSRVDGYSGSCCDMMKVLSKQITHLFQSLGKKMILAPRQKVYPLHKVASTIASVTLQHLQFKGPSGLGPSNRRYIGKVVEFIDGILQNTPDLCNGILQNTPDSCNPVILISLYHGGVIKCILTNVEDTSHASSLASFCKLLDHLTTTSFISNPLETLFPSTELVDYQSFHPIFVEHHNSICSALATVKNSSHISECSHEFLASFFEVTKHISSDRATHLSICKRLVQMKDSLKSDQWACLMHHFMWNDQFVLFLIDLLSHEGYSNMPFSAFHVLALMLNEHTFALEFAYKKGLVKVSSGLLSKWNSDSHNQDISQVPEWVTAAFVAIDLTLSSSVKHLHVVEQKKLIHLACGCIKKQLPSATMHAVLQLCSTLSRTDSVAVCFLEARGLLSLLSLPTSSLFVGFDNIAATIIQHILEGSQTLQEAHNFSSVIRQLLDKIITFKPPTKEESSKDAQESSATMARIVFVLELLTEILVRYPSSIHVVSEMGSTAGIFNHILKLLPHLKKSSKTDAGWSQKLASSINRFLAGSCVLSTEARAIILPEICVAINGFVGSHKGFKAPDSVIQAYIDTLNDVLGARTPTGSHILAEASIFFVNDGLVTSLIGVLRVLDLDHSDSPNVVTGLMKVLEQVTKEHARAAALNAGRAEEPAKPPADTQSRDTQLEHDTDQEYVSDKVFDEEEEEDEDTSDEEEEEDEDASDEEEEEDEDASDEEEEEDVDTSDEEKEEDEDASDEEEEEDEDTSDEDENGVILSLGGGTNGIEHIEVLGRESSISSHTLHVPSRLPLLLEPSSQIVNTHDLYSDRDPEAQAASSLLDFFFSSPRNGHRFKPSGGSPMPAEGFNASQLRRSVPHDHNTEVAPPNSVTEVPANSSQETEQAKEQRNADASGSIDPLFLEVLSKDVRVEISQLSHSVPRDHNADADTDSKSINPEFLVALPADLRAEVLSAQQKFHQPIRRMHQSLELEGQPVEMDIIATRPTDLRDEVHSMFVSERSAERDELSGRGEGLEADGSPLLDTKDLKPLIRLLCAVQSLYKDQIQSLLLNLCAHADTRNSLISTLMDLLMHDSKKLSHSNATEPLYRLFPSHMTCSRLHYVDGVPPLVSRRVLETLTYLARHCSYVAKILLDSVVIAKEDEFHQQQEEEEHMSLVLLSEQPLYLRSIAHLEQLLHLLDVIIDKAGSEPRQGDSVLTRLPQVELQKLCLLSLAKESLTDNAYTIAAEVLKKLVATTKLNTSVSDLVNSAREQSRISGEEGKGLLSISSSYGDAILRVLQAVGCPFEWDFTEIVSLLQELIGKNYDPKTMPHLPAGSQNLLPYIQSFVVMCEKLKLGGFSHRLVSFSEEHRSLLNAFILQDPRLLEESFSPLLKVPHAIDFTRRVSFFRSKMDHKNVPLPIQVSRDHILRDSYEKLHKHRVVYLKGKLTVIFKDGEEGIDEGGLTREWYLFLSRALFNNDEPFFKTADKESGFQPNRNSDISDLSYFKFAGRMVGKALFDGQLLDVRFTRPFYKHILGINVTYEDMKSVDPEHYRNLQWMLDNDVPEGFSQTFSITNGEQAIDVELKRGGRDIEVTDRNKKEYVKLVGEFIMTKSIRRQINAFLKGFYDLIPRNLISMFNEDELELLISGLPKINVSDWMENTEYDDNCVQYRGVIEWFWEVVKGFSEDDKARLLQFVTGTSKVPLGGFKALQGDSGVQRFQISMVLHLDYFPRAHTCFNKLHLPIYSSKEKLEEKLLFAMRETKGFGFG